MQRYLLNELWKWTEKLCKKQLVKKLSTVDKRWFKQRSFYGFLSRRYYNELFRTRILYKSRQCKLFIYYKVFAG